MLQLPINFYGFDFFHLELRLEVDILSKLDHPNITHLVDFMEDKDQFYVVMENIRGGELFERIVRRSHYTERDARGVISIFLRTLKFVHDKDYGEFVQYLPCSNDIVVL